MEKFLLKLLPFPNNLEGFKFLYEKICYVFTPKDKLKAGIEITGR